jgi:hypothetical protein
MSSWHLAQINIARFVRDKDDAANADFMAALDRVNALADASPGFVWRLVGEGNDAVGIAVAADDPRLIVNMSVWTDVAALEAFAYRDPDHVAVMRRRREWMEHMPVYQALWWVPAGHEPSIGEGMERIAWLRADGPTPRAFTFTQRFPVPEGDT